MHKCPFGCSELFSLSSFCSKEVKRFHPRHCESIEVRIVWQRVLIDFLSWWTPVDAWACRTLWCERLMIMMLAAVGNGNESCFCFSSSSELQAASVEIQGFGLRSWKRQASSQGIFSGLSYESCHAAYLKRSSCRPPNNRTRCTWRDEYLKSVLTHWF